MILTPPFFSFCRRGMFARMAFLPLFAIAVFLSAAGSAHAATYTVETLDDTLSGGPGTRYGCDSVGGDLCSLRGALLASNDSGTVDDIINFLPGLSGTITLTEGQLLITDTVTVSGPGARQLSISGGGNSRVFQIEPIINLFSLSATVNISGITITGGNGAVNTIAGIPLTPGPGGAILNTGGATLNLSEVNISGNNIPVYGGVSSDLLVGGAVATLLGVDLRPTVTNITRSLIANNSAVGGGGGISNVGTGISLLGAVTTVTNSTISNNVTAGAGGGLLNVGGTLNLANATISDNTSVAAGGGVVSVTALGLLGVTNVRNTIIARNNAQIVGGILSLSDDVFGLPGSFNSRGNNLIGNNVNAAIDFQASIFVGTSPLPNVNADLVGSVSVGTSVIDPRLGPIVNNGGPTNSRALLSGSPAIDAGNNCVTAPGSNPCGTKNTPPDQLSTDQRSSGFPRLVDTAVDIGAIEGPAEAVDLVLTVNTLSDHLPDGCTPGDCTLREAILDTNATVSADTIVFDPSLTGGTIVLEDGEGFGELLITDSLTIIGPNGCARDLTISGNNTSRVFHINPAVLGTGIDVTISGVTVTGGNGAANTLLGLPVTPGPGGGILNGGGATLNLIGVDVSGNSAQILGLVPTNLLVGGGIATVGTDLSRTTTNISRSLISSNSALGGGGGISNVGTGLTVLGATTVLTNSTVTDNSAGTLLDGAAGGGILNAAGTMFLTNSTISHNRALLLGGGIVNVLGLPPVGVVTMRNTLVAQNTSLLGTDLLFPDTAGIFNSLGNNLIGNSGLPGITVGLSANVTAGGIPVGASIDIVGSVQIGFVVVDPLLGPLMNNGGCTDTRAPGTGSPVIDRGSNCVALGTCSTFNPNEPILSTDQRYSPLVRPADGDNDGISVVDIGAFEHQLSPTAGGAAVGGRVLDAAGRGLAGATVRIMDQNGNFETALTNGFGFYSFVDVEAGSAYVISVQSKRYSFSPRMINLTDDVTGLDFVPNPRSAQ